MGTVLNMKGVGEMVPEGDYPVILMRVTEKQSAKGTGTVFTFQAVIRGSDTDYDNRNLFAPVFVSNDPDADISNSLFRIQQNLLAFGADSDEVTGDSLDPCAVAKNLVSNKAIAKVAHRVDSNDPEKKFYNIVFTESDL